ncbi:MAG: MFS transporter [Actinomycetota bacterium]
MTAGDTQPTQSLPVRFGWVSLFQDLGSKMVVPMVPLFLATTLSASPLVIGLVDGIAAATVAASAPFAGRLTSRFGPLPLTRAGYGLSSIAKPALALATGWGVVLAVRVVDRLGKGVRDAPRDMLLSAAGKDDERGRRFGVQQAMDKFGGFLGPLAGLGLYHLFDGSFRWVFVAAFVPCVISVIVLWQIRADDGASHPVDAPGEPLSTTTAQRRLLFVLAGSTLFTVPTGLLLLRGLELDAGISALLGAFAVHRLATAVCAVPAGHLTDRHGPAVAVRLGLTCLVAALAIATTDAGWGIWLALGLVGVADALLRTGAKTWLAALGPVAARVGAFGSLASVNAAAALGAGVMFGTLWADSGRTSLFVGCIGVAIAGFASLGISAHERAD